MCSNPSVVTARYNLKSLMQIAKTIRWQLENCWEMLNYFNCHNWELYKSLWNVNYRVSQQRKPLKQRAKWEISDFPSFHILPFPHFLAYWFGYERKLLLLIISRGKVTLFLLPVVRLHKIHMHRTIRRLSSTSQITMNSYLSFPYVSSMI